MPVQVFKGVPGTLAYLGLRHRLRLFTKGSPQEIVPEKNEAAYRALVERDRRLAPAAWMVGNSSRSDINPALAAGLNAVFVPSPNSRDYENEEIRPGRGRLLILKSFCELQRYF